MASVAQTSAEEIEAKWQAQHRDLRDKFYREALHEAGLNTGQDEPPTDGSGHGGRTS